MSWLRLGDTVAFDPRTLAPFDLIDADESTVDETFGFAVRVSAEAAGKLTDRIVTRGIARSVAGSVARADVMMGRLVASGIYATCEAGWQLVNDPKYMHILSNDEIEREKIRRNDMANDNLTVPARLRDGDNCRYCNRPVKWGDQRSNGGAQYEHVNIENQPTRLEEYCVVCRGCNSNHTFRPALRKPPTQPVYGPATMDFITNRLGFWPEPDQITQILRRAQRTAKATATTTQRTPEDNAAASQRPSEENADEGQRAKAENATQNTPQRPESISGNASGTSTPEAQEHPPGARTGPRAPDRSIAGLRNPDSPGRDGTGRDRVLSGRDGPGLDAARPPGSKRSRRGNQARGVNHGN